MIHARLDYQRIQDPLGLIPDNEPVFLIRAQDPIGSAVVRYWGELQAERSGGPTVMTEAVERHADLMDEWPVKKSLADAPCGVLR